ncbi:MAG TPA: hypothetical protein HPQ00_09380, partial [Magnetococcales bacterium]|nr:hypothetical protein [Magnetococcales bacterium]
VLAVGMVILLHRRRWLLSFFMLVGLILGLLIEWAWFWVQLGDPFARIHYLRGINAVVDGVNANFETLNLVSFLLRFPRVVHYTQSAESTLFLLAIFGFLLWCRQWKNLEAKIKLILFVVPPAFVILSVKGISPIQPYFDIVLRYYVPFLPFVYLAVADFFLWGLTRWRQNHGKTLRYAFQFAVVASCSVMMLWNLLIAAEQMPRVKKNGFDSNTRIQSAIDVDSAQTHTPKRIYLNGGMESIGPLYFPAKEGWTTGVATGMDNILPVFSEPGYFILSWPRINSSGNERPFALSRLFLDYPLIFRHHVHDAVTDVYRVGPQKIKREQTVLSLRSWTVTGADGQSSPGVARVPKDGQIMMGSGGAFEPAEPLVAGKWLHIRLQGKTENSFAILKGYLHDLNHGTAPDKPRILPLGVFYFERVAH